MTTNQTFSRARLLFGLVGVSIVCTTILLLPKSWAAHRIGEYIYLLLLPTIGYSCVFYWSRIFAKLHAFQRVVIGSLLGFVLALGFTVAFLDCLVPVICPVIYKPPFYEQKLQSGSLPLQDVRWGCHGDQLLFVVFQTSVNGESHTEFKITPIPEPTTTPGHVITPHYDHWIELPDGTRKDLPSSRTMFEYELGGALTSRPIDVSLNEFREWIASRPKIYSIEKLEEFVVQQRTHT